MGSILIFLPFQVQGCAGRGPGLRDPAGVLLPPEALEKGKTLLLVDFWTPKSYF